MEVLVQLDAARDGEAVAEHQRLALGVAAVGAVMLNHALAPLEGVAGVVARAVKELAEIHVEVAEERFHAVHVRERNAQIAPVFLRPLLEGKHLAVAQAGAERLTRLQVFVRHRAQRAQPKLLGKEHVAGAGELAAALLVQPLLQRGEHFALPRKRKAPPRAVVGEHQLLQPGRVQHVDFFVQPPAPFAPVKVGVGAAHVDLADDGQHGYLEHDGVQPGAGHANGDVAVFQRRDIDVFLVELEEAEEVHKVALDEAQIAHVAQFVFGEAQRAELVDFALDFLHKGRQRHAGRAALELVFHLRGGKLVQHGLHHAEFVEVGVKQAGDDGGHGMKRLLETWGAQRARRVAV